MAYKNAGEDTASFDDLEFERFNPGDHAIENFDCGKEDLNEFINSEEAELYQRKRLGVTTLVYYSGQLAAYYTIAPTALNRSEYTGDEHPAADELHDKLPSIPSLLLGRFAVQKDSQGIGLGQLLVEYVIAWALERRDLLFRVIVLHARDEITGFYEECCFVLSESRKNKNRNQKIMYYVLDPLAEGT